MTPGNQYTNSHANRLPLFPTDLPATTTDFKKLQVLDRLPELHPDREQLPDGV